MEKRALLVDSYKDLKAVVNLLFVTDWGCVHLRCEWLLRTGESL